jgi:dihydrolipoamide dehydrogenase
VIVGAGAVGVEWAEIWRAFGSEVTIVEMLPQIVPTEEPEIGRELARAFGREGITCLTSAQVREIRSAADGLGVVVAVEGEERVLPADVVLAAVGRRPNVAALGLSAAGVDWNARSIPTDPYMRTNVAHILAIGDATGRSLLAHAATHQGMIAAETIAGHDVAPFDPRLVPGAIFTDPEIASIGLKEADARAQGMPVTVARFPFLASGRAVASGETTGFVKIVADESSGEVLGVHIVGSRAGDLIGEASLAMRLHATVSDLADTIHVHPTFSEALLEAAWVGLGTPLHVPPRQRRAAQTEVRP